MPYSSRILNIPHNDRLLQQKISQSLGISKVLSQLLINRKIHSVKEAENFLRNKLSSLLDPYSFGDMERSVSLIRRSIRDKHKIMIFGDYDVDGVTAVAVLKSALLKAGADVSHYIPHRIKEGYGLSKDVVGLAKEKKSKLVITVDCGTNSHEEIAQLRRNNIDVIITDHHEPIGGKNHSASAIINPKIKQSGYAFRDLAGVGVAYKLAQALSGQDLFEDLDLVTLGTVADVVPLLGENRVIVKEGLRKFTATKKIGLKALMQKSGIANKKFSPYFISYILGPRINASGRMDTADVALDLIMSSTHEEAAELSEKIELYNRQRQKIESKILDEAQSIIEQEVDFKEHRVIVIAKQDWHHGVLGIVASKLSDRFYRPTVLISLGDKMCKGSARSIKNFHLFNALISCKDLLHNFGGHSHAAGLVIEKRNINDFKKAINSFAKDNMRLEDFMPSIDIDMQVDFSQINMQLARELELLEPYGASNPEPLFHTSKVKLRGEPLTLARETLKFRVTDGQYSYQAIAFGMSSFKDSLMKCEHFDIIYTPRIDDWSGEENLLLEVKDIILR